MSKVTPIVIGDVSHSQLSVARHYGGCTFNGAEYRYFAEQDILVRKDWVRCYTKMTRKEFVEAASKSDKPPKLTKQQRISRMENPTKSLFD